MARKKTKPTDWRKERRANEGSIRERNGKSTLAFNSSAMTANATTKNVKREIESTHEN